MLPATEGFSSPQRERCIAYTTQLVRIISKVDVLKEAVVIRFNGCPYQGYDESG